MTRPLRILFATAHPHLLQIAGGLQANTDETMKSLIARGHDVWLLCGLTGAGTLGFRHRIAMKLSPTNTVKDPVAGYTTIPACDATDSAIPTEVLRDFAADVALAHAARTLDPAVQLYLLEKLMRDRIEANLCQKGVLPLERSVIDPELVER